jgi:hypothetical protein
MEQAMRYTAIALIALLGLLAALNTGCGASKKQDPGTIVLPPD